MEKTPEAGTKPQPTVFLDRDGTFLDDPGYLGDPEGIRFLSGAVEAMRELIEGGFSLIVVTNQSGIGRGYFSEEQALAVNLKMTRMLSDEGVRLEGIYFCAHHPDARCQCRKPGTMMVERAMSDFGIETGTSWVVGDVDKDVQLGLKTGLRPILVETGKEEKGEIPQGVTVVPDLKAAIGVIFKGER